MRSNINTTTDNDLPGQENDLWGDDELLAQDLSATMLLSRADLTRFFNGKGYPGTYPALIYFSDEAEQLSDLIFSEIARSQTPDARPRFVIDVETAFKGEGEAKEGTVRVRMTGTEALDDRVREDIITLMLDGIRNWLEAAYSTHGKQARITWQEKGETSVGTITPYPAIS